MTEENHSWFAYPTFYLVTFITFLGMLSRVLMIGCKWNTKFIIGFKILHVTISYAIILCGNVAVFTGIVLYRTSRESKNPTGVALEWINIGIIIFIGLISEFLYQARLNKEDPFVVKGSDKLLQKPITQEEFENRVKNGEKLVVLDDLVLDVSIYMYDHPAGCFSIL